MNVNNNDLQNTLVDTFQELIKRFKNIHTENKSDNIQQCKYYKLADQKKVFDLTGSNESISMIHLNIVSLSLNFDKVKTLLYALDTQPSVIALSESRIHKNNVDSTDIDLPGYKFLYDPSPTNGTAGGAALYVKESLSPVLRNDLRISNAECENLWIELSFQNKPVIFFVIYRHPRQKLSLRLEFQNQLKRNLELLENKNLQPVQT